MDSYISLELAEASLYRMCEELDPDWRENPHIDAVIWTLEEIPDADVIPVTWIENMAERPENAGMKSAMWKALVKLFKESK